ncbi:MAG: hypothetical protein KFB93_00725 [Simkaniaceae bacterium]|jgi:hypothetical protein|nr:MAG: hypothetical protein KFB93_00725 [Simkaniaceae bacterium]
MELLRSMQPSFLKPAQAGQAEELQRNQSASSEIRAAATLNTISEFFQENYRPLITAFLLYFVALGSITKLKGKELIAASAGSAAWTVVNGAGIVGLAATAPIVYGVARMLFNWATTPSSTSYQRPRVDPFLHRQEQRREQQVRRQPPVSVASVHDNTTSLDQVDLRAFDQAWEGASRTLAQEAKPLASEKLSIESAATKASHRSTPTLPLTPSRVDILPSLIVGTPVMASIGEQVDNLPRPTVDADLEAAWDEVRSSKGSETVDLEAEFEAFKAVEREESAPLTPVSDTVVKAPAQEEARVESDKGAAFKERLTEARRIAWEFASIVTEKQRDMMPKANLTVGMLLFERERFFDLMMATPNQRIIVLLPSVLTEAQKEKIADLDFEGRCQSVNHFQSQFFKFLELTPAQKNALMPERRAKL